MGLWPIFMVIGGYLGFILNAPIASAVVCFLVCWNDEEVSMTNSRGPNQTDPIGAVWSGSTLFASVRIFVSNVR